MQAVLVFPHQLFEEHPLFTLDGAKWYLVEDTLFFGDPKKDCIQHFHWQKLLLHRASMQEYFQYLKLQKKEVEYSAYTENLLVHVVESIQHQGIKEVHVLEVVDAYLEQRLRQACHAYGLDLVLHETPGFLNSREDNAAFFDPAKKRYLQKDFYVHQRKWLDILINPGGAPVGGKWSFDAENRRRLPAKLDLPEAPFTATRRHDVETSIRETFPGALGDMSQPLLYPANFAEAKSWLAVFLKERFAQFGPYEDALHTTESVLFHSVLTPMLNIGLLTPRYILQQVLAYAETNDIPLQSLEGFIRQLIGWREFMRGSYQEIGGKMRTQNVWHHTEKMPASFYQGTTGVLPIDTVIQRLLKTGYAHHIERLMVLGGFFFLCEIDPEEVYRWFMELFIDSYDWVMVTNVFAMSQNACGDLITTKPYFSGSNYILKMSNYPKGEAWSDIWDGLYWRWIWKHKEALKKNPRWAMMCATAEKMDAQKREQHLAKAEQFLSTIRSS